MTVEEEVKQTYEMLKKSGLGVVEIVFEGGFSVLDTDVLHLLQEMIDKGKAYGVVHIVYRNKEGKERVIDIPTHEEEGEGEGE